MKTLLIIIFCLLLFSAAHAEQKGDTVVTTNTFGIMAYPIVFYSPETDLAGGVGGMVYFRTTTKKYVRPSKVILSAWYTVNDQYYFKIAPQIYFPGADRDLLDLRFTYSKEISKFYGLGNKTEEIENPEYTMHSLRLYAEFGALNIISENIHFGLIFDYSPHNDIDKESNPFLNNGDIEGNGGGNVTGIGALLIWDKRDNLFYPTKDYFYKLRLQFFDSYLGSDFSFNRLVADLRHYLSPIPTHILAFQLYADLVSGSPPFFRLPALGGDQRMRGYFTGRYRDRLYLTGQVEYRKIIWWRIGVAAFIAAGDVAGDWNDFYLNNIKYTYGFGLRFVFDKDEQINVRMDLGYGKGTSGIYFSLEEAF